MDVKPYYSEPGITIYHGDCRDILPHLPKVDLVLTDPPYGIAHPTNYHSRGRGKMAACKDYAPVFMDDEPFDPALILSMNVPTILFGAEHYCSRLPDSPGWLVWDKMRPDSLDQATCELAWTNFVRGTRRFRYLWHGMIRASNEDITHPTQKPIALMEWCLSLKWTPGGITVDPYAGSFTTAVACKKLGRPFIGIEIEKKYCDIAIDRLRQEVLPLNTITNEPTEQGVIF